jgi:death-on-curing protein
MREPVWLAEALVLAIHEQQLAEHGGSSGVRDAGMLQSALARPLHKFAYGGEGMDMSALAAAYAYGIARNHPFVDGNKRTAAVACETFLDLNERRLTATDMDLYPMM